MGMFGHMFGGCVKGQTQHRDMKGKKNCLFTALSLSAMFTISCVYST